MALGAGDIVRGVELNSYCRDIHVEREADITTVTLDRPQSKNGCTGEMWVSLGAIFRDIAWSGARVAIITGAGGNFCSGADLMPTAGPSLGRPEATMVDAMRVVAESVLAIHNCPVPVISKVDGVCVGAGMGVMLAADMTWCSEQARFSLIFAKRGLSLDWGTSWLLQQRIGIHRAKEMALTAKIVGAPEAREMGFVNGVVAGAELDEVVTSVAASIAAGPPGALSHSKRQLNNAASSSLATALEMEALAQSVNANTADMREAMTAFMERREPKFTGQ